MNLAAYAADPTKTQGRAFYEPPSLIRNDYQRDRDRIIHSASFRRLQYKTQVFVNHEGDMFRSRLTHSLEVAQIARGVSRTLNCHEDLSEAIALAHDLGHTPFGHAGQDALNQCMKSHGGFEHNLQSLRVVDQLEKRYLGFDGLNLTFEVREGILKRCSRNKAFGMGELGKRFIEKKQPSLEAQIVNIADEIAYLHHDIDDGFRSGILTFEVLEELELFKCLSNQISTDGKFTSKEQFLNEVLRKMMNLIIYDFGEETKKRLKRFNPRSSDEVRNLPKIAKFSESIEKHVLEIRTFSKERLYKHKRIKNMGEEAASVIKRLFKFFLNQFDMVPSSFKTSSNASKERIISDYIAGMTDRFALQLINDLKI